MRKVMVSDILKLEIMNGYRVVSGLTGLANEVHYVNVYDTKVTEIDSSIQVFPGDIYLTTLYFGVNDEKFVIDFIRMLIGLKASAVIITDENISSIPLEAARASDDAGLPVIFMDSRTPYSLIISGIMEYRLTFEHQNNIEKKIDDLTDPRISKSEKNDISLDLNPSFQDNVMCMFVLEKDMVTNAITPGKDRPNLRNLINRSVFSFASEYRSGLVIILSFSDARLERAEHKREISDTLDLIRRYCPLSLIGLSTVKKLSELGEAVSESYIALLSGYTDANGLADYSKIGISRILLEYRNSKIIEDFYSDMTGPVMDFDRLSNTSLFSTMLAFVDNDMDYKATAKVLSVHENTIRYRIGKIKEMIPYGKSEIDFYETISLTSKIYRIKSF